MMTKFKVTFPVQADCTVEVEAPSTATKSDIIKLLNEEMVWEADYDYNSDVARDALTEYQYASNPEYWFTIFDDNDEEIQ